MNRKSHFSLKDCPCLVCNQMPGGGEPTGPVPGWGFCAQHGALYEQGFIAIVEVDFGAAGVPASGTWLNLENLVRTGRLLHLKRDIVETIVEDDLGAVPCIFAPVGHFETYQKKLGNH